MSRLHDDELAIDAEVVRVLIDEQFPEWSKLDLRPVVAEGTVNAIFRLGDDLAVRLPLQPTDEGVLDAEHRAAAAFAAATSVPSPEVVAVGRPDEAYPQAWTVQTWLAGATATAVDPAGSIGFAEHLAALIAELRAVPTDGRVFTGGGRGGALSDHDLWVATCLERSEGLLEVEPLRELWAAFRGLPHAAPDVMSHGDLLPGNLLVADGRLCGVLDVGGFGPADPALDLICAWNTLDAAPRAALREALGSGDVEWERGRAWAFQQAMGLVWYYVETNPVMSELGRRSLDRLLEG